ncbi:hypothetical protein EHF33_01025 [Deinococcus psychrotolerans]|uniref:Uncharacterized protein n=1 Tax=Deinococcus psychrotolerans TaxID=2489213 RepID=A0A3G8Y808_9DEIO|nr:hypothetical protein [Deinococcus psychrotolerans]AZI41512.1 hypothetical protein EHF33_01025 [Deinococcus psychrotolerans]
MLNWLPYVVYFICVLTGLSSLRMFWMGGTPTLLSGFLALGGAIWAAWYVATVSKRPHLSAAFKDLAFSSVCGSVSALGWMQRLVLRSEHGPALDSFESGVFIFLLCFLVFMAVSWLVIHRAQDFKSRAGRV